MRTPRRTGAAVMVVLAITGCRGVLGLGDYEFVDAGGAESSSGAGGIAGVGGVGGSSEKGGAGGVAGSSGTGGEAGAGGIAGSSGNGGTAGAGGVAGSSGNGGTAGAGGVAGSSGTGGGAGAGGIAGSSGTGGGAGDGGVAGSSGNGGAGGTGGGCGSCGALEQCFDNQVCVAKLVSVTDGYSIDATEVTVDQYAAKLGNLSSMGQPTECSWNTDFTPTCEWPPGAKGSHPAVCVDWCDAYAYCKTVGKRLCGRIGGGESLWTDYQDATKSQWFNVCSSGGANEYPYLGPYQSATCNGADANQGGAVAVGTMSACVSQGVYDLSGNVWEWEDSCNGKTGANDYCRLRGGNFGADFGHLRCGYGSFWDRGNRSPNVGFRCCAP